MKGGKRILIVKMSFLIHLLIQFRTYKTAL